MTTAHEIDPASIDLLGAYGPARSTVSGMPLSADELRNTDAWWRACKYLALGMIYLRANPLLKEPLKPEHIKNRLLGHWGSSPGLAFIYTHLNRVIKRYDQDMIFLAGPGHGAPGVLGPVYLEGSYSEIYTDKSEDEEGLLAFFRQFSFPGGIGSHCTPETPGSIHEGGELGYVLSHACGAAFDNPNLIVAAVVGDGESETGPLANDMRDLLEELALHDDHRARVAIDVFCYHVRKYIGAFLAVMGGAGAIVFTGGIGENSPAIRGQIGQGLEGIGLRLDADRNQMPAGAEGAITADGSPIAAYVIPTDEELLIARDSVNAASNHL